MRTAFLKDHPDVVQNFLKGHVEATDYVNQYPAEAQAAANTAIGQLTSKPLAAATVAAAWKNLTFTWDPLASTLRKEASDAEAVGLLTKVNLNGLVDVTPLNTVLKADGKPTVSRMTHTLSTDISEVVDQVAKAVSISEVSKVYGPAGAHTFALDRISLDVDNGEFVCLVGASGCGKTTLLNLVAGLDHPGKGEISVEGRPALLFQDAGLFPWLTVERNVELALRLRKVPRAARAQRVTELLHAVHLDDFSDRRPHELSGGMRQRVALARASPRRPRSS